MTKLTTAEKYGQREVVAFWKKLSRDGLQKCEQEMVTRYYPATGRLLDLGCGADSTLGKRESGISTSIIPPPIRLANRLSREWSGLVSRA